MGDHPEEASVVGGGESVVCVSLLETPGHQNMSREVPVLTTASASRVDP